MVVTARRNSGLAIGKWLEKGISFRERRGVVQGYYFMNSKGGMMRAKDLEVDIFDRIARIQKIYLDFIRPGLEVHEEYGLSRSFRRVQTRRSKIEECWIVISIEIIDGGR